MKKCSKIPTPENGIEIRKSICTICDPATQCGLSLYVKDGTVIKVEGDENQPYGKGTLCAKGASSRQYLYNEERIKTPLKRVGPKGSDEFEPISWDEAYAEIAKNFISAKENYGAESVVFASGYSKYYRPWLKRLCHSFGSPNYISEASSCFLGMWMGHKLTAGERGDPDWANGTKCAIIWSANPFYTNPGNARRIQMSLDQGMKLIVVDPRRTPTSEKAHIHLRLRPGTDGALALAMANVIINEDLYDKDFVANYSYGFEEYKEYVMGFTPERGEELTGVPADTIRAAARMFATNKPSAIMSSAAPVVHHTNGVQNQRAILCLPGLIGMFDAKGGNKASSPSFLHAPGQFVSKQVEFRQSRSYDEMAPRIAAEQFPTWTSLIDEEVQGMVFPEQVRTGKPYPLKAMYGVGLNFRMWADSQGMADAIKSLDFFVAQDIFMSDTCKLADIVLPACTSMERNEFRCWGTGYVVCTTPAIPPIHESKSDVDIICELAKLIAPEDELLCAGFAAGLDYILEPSGMTFEELTKHPSGMKVPNPVPNPCYKYKERGFKTPSGKFEFKSKVLEADPKPEVDALPTYRPPRYSKEGSPELFEEYPLTLNTGSRLPMFIHSRAYRIKWSSSLRPTAPDVELHPNDAAKYGVKNGDKIKIITVKGFVVATVSTTTIAQEGVVHIYHGHRDADVNTLLEHDYLDPISGYPGYKGALCRIEKI